MSLTKVGLIKQIICLYLYMNGRHRQSLCLNKSKWNALPLQQTLCEDHSFIHSFILSFSHAVCKFLLHKTPPTRIWPSLSYLNALTWNIWVSFCNRSGGSYIEAIKKERTYQSTMEDSAYFGCVTAASGHQLQSGI